MSNVKWDILDDIEYNGQPLAKLDRDKAEIDDCTCIGETEKALIIRFNGHNNTTRPVPKSQIHADSEVRAKGDVGQLSVTQWLGRKLNRELQDGGMLDVIAQAADSVEIPDCICLSETEASLLVDMGDGTEQRWPKSQLRGGDIAHDSDTGTLKVSTWIAKKNGRA